MSGFDISGLEYGASNDEIVDALARLQKQLEFMMNGNLGSKNIREVGDFLAGPDSFMSRSGNVGLSSLVTGANDVRFWAGNVIPASAPFRVYESGLMIASNAEITGKITAILGAIGGWVIGATSIFDVAGIVGLSSAVTTGNDLRLWAGNVIPDSAPFRVYEDGSVAATKVTITGKNASIMINEWGMNPDFIKRFPNKIINSGFEWYDEVTSAPAYWDTTGKVTKNSNWDGTVALQLAPTQYIEQGMLTIDTHAGADPAWWDNIQTRVSLKYRGGAIKVKVLKVSDSSAYTIFDNSADIIRSGLFLDYPVSPNWDDGYVSIYFTPIPGAGKVKIRVENIDAASNAYIDAVQIEPDFTGMWPSLYSSGPRSLPMSDTMSIPGVTGIYHGLDADKPYIG